MRVMPVVPITIPIVRMRPATFGRFVALAACAVFAFIGGMATFGLFSEHAPDMPNYVPFITLALTAACVGGAVKVAKGFVRTR